MSDDLGRPPAVHASVPRVDTRRRQPLPHVAGVAYLTALAALPGLGPARLLALQQAGDPVGAWKEVAAGRAHRLPALLGRLGRNPEAIAGRWATAARPIEPGEHFARHLEAGIEVLELDTSGYPVALCDDPSPPAVLFLLGDRRVLDQPSVAVVGTRNATRLGRELAHELGSGLASAGVAVVSGLALGIDGAAHRGVLAALTARRDEETGATGRPIGVVASGLDIAYPRRHAALHEEVRAAGVLVSEVPLGLRPEAWRFPARNRIIAGLAEAVVVVESRATGGSMLTAEAALERDKVVLAVPGNVRSAASAGTNDLIATGATPARDLEDVLVALGRGGSGRRARRRPPARPADPNDRALLDALGWDPITLADVVDRLGGQIDAIAAAIVRLELDGWIERRDGWLERVGRREP